MHAHYPFPTELCLQAWEEQEGGKAPSCTTCYFRARPGDSLVVTSENLTDNYDKQAP